MKRDETEGAEECISFLGMREEGRRQNIDEKTDRQAEERDESSCGSSRLERREREREKFRESGQIGEGRQNVGDRNADPKETDSNASLARMLCYDVCLLGDEDWRQRLGFIEGEGRGTRDGVWERRDEEQGGTATYIRGGRAGAFWRNMPPLSL